MQFKDFQYTRPDMIPFSAQFSALLAQFEQAASFEEQAALFTKISDMRTDFNSMYNICYIRHTINTRDEFYEKEQAFYDQELPNFEALNNQFYKKLLSSPFRKELEARWGKQLFVIAAYSQKTFSPAIVEDMQEENRLSTAYMQLKAGAKIQFNGEECNLSSIQKYEHAKDRATRKAAAAAKWRFFEQHQQEIEAIFDKLVKLRHQIATKLGYQNFVELAYARMLRSDYDASMVATFREQIRQYIVPIASQLYERQRRRMQVDTLQYYDEEVRFLSGNPTPKGDAQWIIGNAQKMYRALSSETGSFFDFMLQTGLLDVETRPGKATGGYCTFIGNHKSPYIFSNFNGTAGDIEVLTHEAGHAFQMYASRDIGISEYHFPTYEACEIHSMSMEFFTWPWMPLFFLQDADKFKFNHISNSICFLPYGVAVDEFQHFVYENPYVTPQARNEAWRTIEKKYLPQRDYSENVFLENGGFWQKQNHIFTTPFYYVDYVLAQICAFQFWKKDSENHEQAWLDYIKLCQAGGSLSFLELVKLANLRSPFDAQCVQSVIDIIETWLGSIDDSQF